MMKYRDHSLRYVPRSTKRPVRRPAQSQPLVTTSPPDELDGPFVHRHASDTEPLIDIHDKDSRAQKIKDGFGTMAHAAAYIASTHILPRAKQQAQHVKSRVQNSTSQGAPTAAARAKRGRLASLKTYQKVGVVVGVLALCYYFATHNGILPSQNNTASQTGAQLAGQSEEMSPSYTTFLPAGKSIQELGGWKRVSPPSSNPVFAYVDQLDNVQINVSQQPLPENFSPNPDKDVRDLAVGFSAKDRHVADDATVYFLGESPKGPQSVILAKKQTLILIKSKMQIKTASWSRYIGSLK